MTTVGFGDYFPRTYVGKVIIIVTAFYGTFLVSMMIVTLTNSKDFSVVEDRSFTIVRRIHMRKKIDKLAAKIIILFFKSIIKRRKNAHRQHEPLYQQSIIEQQELIERLLE